MSDDDREVKDVNEFDDLGELQPGADAPEAEEVAPSRFPRWLLYIGGLVIFNVLSYVFDWGWVLW